MPLAMVFVGCFFIFANAKVPAVVSLSFVRLL